MQGGGDSAWPAEPRPTPARPILAGCRPVAQTLGGAALQLLPGLCLPLLLDLLPAVHAPQVLVGAMLLDQIKRQGGQGGETLLARMGEFLARPNERAAVLGEDGKGSASFHRLTGGEQ